LLTRQELSNNLVISTLPVFDAIPAPLTMPLCMHGFWPEYVNDTPECSMGPLF
jgi:hypothetical protein